MARTNLYMEGRNGERQFMPVAADNQGTGTSESIRTMPRRATARVVRAEVVGPGTTSQERRSSANQRNSFLALNCPSRMMGIAHHLTPARSIPPIFRPIWSCPLHDQRRPADRQR